MINIKDVVIAAVAAVCITGAIIALSLQEAHAGFSGGRSSVSVSRSSSSFSSSRPSVTRTASPVVRTTPTVKKPAVANSVTKPRPYYGSHRRDDDVECDTLRNSRYSADRQVYRRYCQ